MKRIGIVGSRRRSHPDDRHKVREAFNLIYEDGDQLVSGGCPSGGDAFAEEIALRFQVPITIHYARWKKFGKSAGFVRNTDIAEQADVLIACVAFDRTGGTEDTITKWCSFHPGEEPILV